MPVQWMVGDEVTAIECLAADADGATPVTGDDFDVRTFDAGTRFLFVLTALETEAANTGGVWTIVESETDGGSYTACTLDGSLAATPAEAGVDTQVVGMFPNPAKPFVHVVFTPADASTDVAAIATCLAVPRAKV